MRFKDEAEYESFLAARKARDTRSMPELKRSFVGEVEEPVEAKARAQAESESCYRIVVISKRHRHADPDNLCPKWYVDELVRAKIIPDDSSKFVCGIEKRIEKIKTSEREETIIEIWKETICKPQS